MAVAAPRSPACDPARPGRRASRLTLAALLGAVLVLVLAWALLLPPWQGPDSTAHFAYVQTLAERGQRPSQNSIPGRRLVWSSAQELAQQRSFARRVEANPAARPNWSAPDFARWRRAAARLAPDARRDGGSENPAAQYLPVYYAYAAAAYDVAGGTIFDRLYAVRIWSGLLLLITVGATWLLAGEVLGRRPILQLAVAGVVGLAPMEVFITSSVNPDALLYPLWALSLWLGVRVLRRGLDVRGGAALVAASVLAGLTQPIGYALLPGAALVLVVGAWRRWARTSRAPTVASAGRERLRAAGRAVRAWAASHRVTFTVATLVAAVVLAAAGLVAVQAARDAVTGGGGSPRGMASYVWQFYLPRLGFMAPVGELPSWPFYDLWIKQAWGVFGWLETRFDAWVYVLLGVVTLLTAIGAVSALVRRRVRLGAAVCAYFVLVALALLVGLHWTGYEQLVSTARGFNQGRYVLPLLPLVGLAAALGLANLRARWQGVGVAALLGCMGVLEIFALALVLGRFYV